MQEDLWKWILVSEAAYPKIFSILTYDLFKYSMYVYLNWSEYFPFLDKPANKKPGDKKKRPKTAGGKWKKKLTKYYLQVKTNQIK